MTATGSGLGVVIGGGNGIGAACCQLMAERGWQVAVVDLDIEAAQAVASPIGAGAYAADISSLEAIERLAAEIERKQGAVTALVVAAAAFEERHAPHDLPMELFQRIIDVNIRGTFNANRTFGTAMAKRSKGAIVNIASSASYGSQPLHAYGPSKAAVVNMTKNLAGHWGRSGVRVNSVSPGPTLVQRVLARPPGRYAVDIDELMALGRRTQPREIAEGVEFLASDRASAITGIDLLIDAGMLTASTWGLYGGVPASLGEQQVAG